MGKYCCFNCIKKDYSEKQLTDLCSICNMPYDFPLKEIPTTIVSEDNISYNVVMPKGRGFYAVTYLCTSGKFDEETILKVTPARIYDELKNFNRKEETSYGVFAKECVEHSDISKGTDHIVKIKNYFRADVTFGNHIIPCFVSELEYINGTTFNEFINEDSNINARNFAQLAIDLIRIWSELQNKQKYHNDLHGDNLIVEQLGQNIRRIDELNSSIRLMVIDLNSSKEESLSNTDRFGDQTQIYNHLKRMSELINNKVTTKATDSDFRIKETLEKITNLIAPLSERSRVPTPDELIHIVKEDFNSNLSYAPWERNFVLTRLDDGYNAQTIHKCYIPFLLVDPDNKWLKGISVSGPQLITGMRGCGKTTLLGALDFHARANFEHNDTHNRIDILKDDVYVGLSASCSNLIDNRGRASSDNFAKLIWIYTIELLGIIRHLKSLDSDLINPNYKKKVVEFLQCIVTINLLDDPTQLGDSDLEHYLSMKITCFSDADGPKLKDSPKNAFESLALLIMGMSELWNNKKVFFLLDDASIRYLKVDTIIDLFSNLLFQSSLCSFKITTEMQSVELMELTSPGNVALAREGRDFTMYDFGAKVLEKIKEKNKNSNGKTFLLKILEKRLSYYVNHPDHPPSKILGNSPLSVIALNIASASKSIELNTAYYGISALAGCCVGDIGDVILLYDRIVQKYKNETPVSKKDQSDCFQDLCSGRLYNLNRRDNKLQQYAISFAEASNYLLVKSKKDYDKKMKEYNDGARKVKPSLRLRQYTSMHVRVTSDEDKKNEQLKKLIELVDAGIFIFASGAPRSKNPGANPILQFKLAYRKLYGIASLIGLSDRDRFELSGEQLDDWLNNPSKEILIKNLKGDDDDNLEYTEDDKSPDRLFDELEDNPNDKSLIKNLKGDDDDNLEYTEVKAEQSEKKELPQMQLSFFDHFSVDENRKNDETLNTDLLYLHEKIKIDKIDLSSGISKKIDLVIIALGFEERASESAKNILNIWNPKKICLIKYPEEGKTNEIVSSIQKKGYGGLIEKIDHDNLVEIYNQIDNVESCLLDITGLSKPLIFSIAEKILSSDKKTIISYTEAEEYYPLEKTIFEKFEETKKMPKYKRFRKIMDGLLIGEKPEYEIRPLLETSDCYSTRPSTLLGFVVSKNQRILTLLENRDYSWAELFVSSGKSYRSQLAQMAADIVKSNYNNIETILSDRKNPEEILKQLLNKYYALYVNQGTNIEIGLTGTKLQTLACAALSSIGKISQCWYVHPAEFDKDQFSIGAKETVYYQFEKK
ncbi:hypothetical protein [Methanorbis rubei]|uniref:Protein kinase domain-containing protein n=1 Tax=Methanorbis rubei TaxID=3028300 RepID=A0AAE4MH87_9EURY|nr:hypothetical protein [Methanocorpusculaceae archaeon Cs1]